MSIETAEQLEENGQYEEAYAEYKKSYSHSPNDLSLLAQLGHVAMILQKSDEAVEYYNKMLTLDATNPTAYEQLMDIYIDTDKYKYYVCRGNYHTVQQQIEHAINDFQKAVAHAGGDEEQVVPVRFVLGTLYEEMGNPNKAIDEYLKVLDYESAMPETYLRLANLYAQDDVLGSAIETLERALQAGHDHEEIRESLAKLYFKNNTPQKVKEVTKNKLTEIKAMLALGELAEAKKELENIDDKYKNDAQYFALLAEYYYTSKDYDKALDSVDKYAEKQPNHPLVFQMRALIYEEKQDEYMATLNWAKYHLVRDQKDVAINELLGAYQLRNDDADMVAMLASLLETSGEVHQAMEFYSRLAELEPNNKTAMEKLSRYWEENGDNRLAAEYLEKLLDADKRNFASMKKLADLYQKMRDRDSAIGWYKKYLQTAPQNEEYDVVKAKLDKLENTEAPTEQSESLLDKIVDFFTKKNEY
ncbi:tetratricopeptide repeat protein [bacterium]|nr:tetratricopeptide repeat protein [bacterium]